MKLKPIVLLFSAIAVLSVWSCGQKEKSGDNTEGFEATKGLNDEIKDLAYNVPEPSEIPFVLQSTGAEFNQSLINDRKKSDSYTTQSEKAAVNLGVYATDIGYLSSYEKTQESIDYLNTCKSLADNLGITGSFDKATLEKFEANIANREELGKLLDGAIKDTKHYLVGENQGKLGALMVTGSFVEGLYISSGIVKSYPKDLLPEDNRNLVLTPLMQLIVNQKESVNEVIKMLEGTEQTGTIPSILADFKGLQASYAALNFDEQLKKNPKLILSDKSLADITAKVEKLRADIVQ